MSKCGVIYKILCKNTGMFYIGSTNNLKERMTKHKNDLTCSSKIIMETNNYQEIVIKLVLYNTTKELEQKEGEIIKQNFYNPLCVNKQMIGRTWKEWYRDNQEKQLNYQKQYRKDNSDKIRKYKEENEKKLKKSQKQYNEDNKERRKELHSQKVKCVCGAFVNKYKLSRHIKTKKHINNIFI